MKKIAHRGVHKTKEEENSLTAFIRAIESEEFAGFEFDVRTSKDGTFVIHHDLWHDGKLIRFLTDDELKSYRLPLLEDVLKLKTKKVMLLEIKEANIDIETFVKLINKYPQTNLYIDSFDNQVIHKLKGKTHAKLGILNYVLNSEENYDSLDFIGLLSPIMTENLFSYFEQKKKEVFIYGIKKGKIEKIKPNVYYIVD